jgi:predicted DNA-binding transcriptional regulator YafY
MMYHPTGRVLTVLELLQSRPYVSGPELAETLETDVRTVRRYVGKLQDVGIPIESLPGRYGGYRLRPGYRMPPLVLSDDEAVAVVACLVGSPGLAVELPAGAAASSLSKITRVLPQTTRERIAGLLSLPVSAGEIPPRPDSSLLLELTQAAALRRPVALEYRGQETTRRTVEPYGLAGFQGHWYVVAYCRLRKAVRVFRLDRIAVSTVLDETFAAPAEFDAQRYLREQAVERKRWTVRLRFQGPATELHSVLGTGDVASDGNLGEYTVRTADLDHVAKVLALSDLGVEVLDPPELRRLLSRVAERALRLAGPTGETADFGNSPIL